VAALTIMNNYIYVIAGKVWHGNLILAKTPLVGIDENKIAINAELAASGLTTIT
jgi:hypothetical protein